ncbi:hypothetical protein VOLCADRAFT_115671 [Volvox carteri f. nagariensis]|uniref:Uncharacterized protein n=1 Tax=Volvox carteri f. nagariensis TaxID=3068 RepID=D8THJ9_VOLCA|nr:uncharacterized protein VOLCADRAFT_115671 [Volvox carteri f. nagariensis]EFJ53083.1 hypothetical protein VOLCADRAFT_115671 [Volvox carteri f. nagariensis]|eukprot:XP_002946088.1 hypothetical protein VOLCADRAFT_115671 [Volvox carteri f. nagariensis]
MPPKMARQSQVPPQTLSPTNLGAYGTPSPSLPSGSSAGAAAKPPVNIADLWAQLAAASPTGGGRDRSSPAGVPRRPLTFKDEFQAQHGAKPASTFLYNVTAEIHEGDMPDRTTATHASVMQLWITAAGSLRADTTIALIYDYGMDAGTILKADQEFAHSDRRSAGDHFTLTRLMSTANPALADKMEALYIAQFKSRGPDGYNVLHRPPSASPAST